MSNKYLSDGRHVITIEGYIDDASSYIHGKGYINRNDNIVYIYSKDKIDILKRDDGIPRFYLSTNGKIELVPPLLNFKEKYSADRIYSLSLETIANQTSDHEELYNEMALNDLNASVSKFVPVIKDEDDFLKKLVKNVIIYKGIDTKVLQHKLAKRYELTNLISSLSGTTKMSVLNFSLWCELLEVKFTVNLYSESDTDFGLSFTSEENLISLDNGNDVPMVWTEFPVTVNDTDDFLKKLVKISIAVKKISKKDLNKKLDKKYELTNLITALTNKTKMTVINFAKWCELLGIKFTITVTDEESVSFQPMNTIIIYDSVKNDVNIKENEND